MRKKVMGALGVVALAGLAFSSTPAVAAPVASSGDASVTAACSRGEKVKARESVKIRKTKSISGTALGLFPKGKNACSLKNEKAKWYDSKCGQGSDQFDYINYRGTKGWVPTTCIVLD
ncbi:hypothetical protein [Streptomyces africanus]|uniref:hypothetical protein n=1 Tax=Streptomyces africanus TaxID=231024 RepID=UPI001180925A|nr:hypothetical protein [Streptomyces africanus]